MRQIQYYYSRGIEYGKVPASSYREDGKVKKRKDGIYLGKVIDKNSHTFFSDERGMFVFNPEDQSFGKADEKYVSDPFPDKRKKERMLLDFGDSFLTNEVIHAMKYHTVISQISYRNQDTLNAMIQYYILQDKANRHAQKWYEGNYIRILYPKANLTSQRISDFLASIGSMEKLHQYFKAHIEWVKTNICSDPAILVDSTGLPNSIHMALSAISNHNGKISREARMTTMVQRDSGYPLMFRLAPGNITDMSSLTCSIQELGMHGVCTDFALLDAGYFTNDNIDQLYKAKIDYLTRLPERNSTLADKVRELLLPNLKSEINLVNYEGRRIYIAHTDIKVGSNNDYDATAYLGYDVDRASDETHKLIKKAQKKKLTNAEFQAAFDDVGLFILVSSLPYRDEEILAAYYVRQLVEQYFDIGKGISKLTPLRVWSEESVRGHLMLSMIAATINLYTMNATKKFYSDREDMYMSLRNQKCIDYSTKINTNEAQSIANEYYDKLKIRCPLYIEKGTNGSLIPHYDLDDFVPDEV